MALSNSPISSVPSGSGKVSHRTLRPVHRRHRFHSAPQHALRNVPFDIPISPPFVPLTTQFQRRANVKHPCRIQERGVEFREDWRIATLREFAQGDTPLCPARNHPSLEFTDRNCENLFSVENLNAAVGISFDAGTGFSVCKRTQDVEFVDHMNRKIAAMRTLKPGLEASNDRALPRTWSTDHEHYRRVQWRCHVPSTTQCP